MSKHFYGFISAFLIYLSFPNVLSPYGFWPVAWFSIVPLIKALEGCGPIQRIFIGLSHGVLLYSLLLLWLFPVHNFGAAAFVLAMSVQSILFSFLCVRTLSPTGDNSQKTILTLSLAVIYVSALWSVCEFARTLLLSGFAWGLSYSQSFQPALIQFSSWGGLYGVSFVIVLVNVLVYRAVYVRDRRALLLAIIIFMSFYLFGYARLSTALSGDLSKQVCAIQPNILPHKKLNDIHFDDNIRHQVALTAKALVDQKPDVIIWPETAYPADIFKDRFWYPRFQKIAKNNNVLFIFGAATIVEGNNFNSAVVLDRFGEINGVYDKQFLVPISEYKPSGVFAKVFSRFYKDYGFDFAHGKKPGVFQDPKDKVRFGIMICSETCYPALARNLVNHGADGMVAILNDGWFLRPEAIMMHAQNAIFRAVETGRSIVSVGNTGWTGVISPQGILEQGKQLPLQQEAYGTFEVSLHQQSTLYSKIGDFFAGACGLFVIMLLILNYLARKKS